MNVPANHEEPKNYGPKLADIFFLVFLAFAMLGVGWVGHLAYREGMKMEETKRNGEAWAKWLSQAGLERGNEGYEFSECSTGFVPVEVNIHTATVKSEAHLENTADSKPEVLTSTAATPALTAQAHTPRTWGPCFKVISSLNGPLADKLNPFTSKPIVVVAKCDMTNRSLAGAMALEKTLATPAGSAVPFINSPLVGSDSISQKTPIRITMCDKGAYPIHIAEIEF